MHVNNPVRERGTRALWRTYRSVSTEDDPENPFPLRLHSSTNPLNFSSAIHQSQTNLLKPKPMGQSKNNQTPIPDQSAQFIVNPVPIGGQLSTNIPTQRHPPHQYAHPLSIVHFNPPPPHNQGISTFTLIDEHTANLSPQQQTDTPIPTCNNWTGATSYVNPTSMNVNNPVRERGTSVLWRPTWR